MDRTPISSRFRLAAMVLLSAVPFVPTPAQQPDPATPTEETEPAGVAADRAIFEKRLAAIRTDHEENLDRLGQQYVKALQATADRLQNEGELELLLGVRKEVERFMQQWSVPENPETGATENVSALRRQYRAARDKRQQGYEEQVAGLVRSYARYLEDRKRALTRDGKLAQALQAKAEAERLAREMAGVLQQEPQTQGHGTEDDPQDDPLPDPPDLDQVHGHGPVVAWYGARPDVLLGPERTPQPDYSLQHDGANAVKDGILRLEGGRTLVEGANELLLAACREKHELTLIAEFKTADMRQTGPARIVSFSLDGQKRNFSLCQERDKLVLRLRTPQTGLNGTEPEVELAQLEKDSVHFLIVTYRPGELHCYLDSDARAVPQIQGDFSNWEPCQIVLGNEWKASRPWRGELRSIAIYPRFMERREARGRMLSQRHKKRKPWQRRR